MSSALRSLRSDRRRNAAAALDQDATPARARELEGRHGNARSLEQVAEVVHADAVAQGGAPDQETPLMKRAGASLKAVDTLLAAAR